jgi:hypothetical protein
VTFHLFDENGDGEITKAELKSVLTEMCKVTKISKSKEEIEKIVLNFFEKVDLNKDEKLKRDELEIEFEKKSENLSEIMSLFPKSDSKIVTDSIFKVSKVLQVEFKDFNYQGNWKQEKDSLLLEDSSYFIF